MIKTQEMVSFPIFAENGQKIQPDTAKYSAGFQESDVLPAEWVNYFENKSSSAITTLNAGVTSIEEELNALVEAGGQSPTSTDNSQVLKSIQYLINQAVKQAALASYPIGALYWSSNPTNPREIFGGEWKQIKDRFILAAGDKYAVGSTGGADDETIGYGQIKLTESNLPAHKHGMEHHHITSTPEAGKHRHAVLAKVTSRSEISNVYPESPIASNVPTKYADYRWDAGYNGSDNPYNYKSYLSTEGDHTHPDSWTSDSYTTDDDKTLKQETDSKGESAQFSILPPYIVKYCWERTA